MRISKNRTLRVYSYMSCFLLIHMATDIIEQRRLRRCEMPACLVTYRAIARLAPAQALYDFSSVSWPHIHRAGARFPCGCEVELDGASCKRLAQYSSGCLRSHFIYSIQASSPSSLSFVRIFSSSLLVSGCTAGATCSYLSNQYLSGSASVYDEP